MGRRLGIHVRLTGHVVGMCGDLFIKADLNRPGPTIL